MRWGNLYNGGNQWSGWASYLSFFRHVADLKLDYTKWAHYEAAAEFGPRFMHSKFWVVSSLPDVLKVDDDRRPHCASGPFCTWPDGRALFYWHGVQVPREWIESPGSIDPKTALEWPNAEQRRCAAEIIGWKRVLEQLDATVVDANPDPHVGTLLSVDLLGSREQFLQYLCGTGRTFAQPVPPDVKTAQEAQYSIWQWGPDMPKPEVRT